MPFSKYSPIPAAFGLALVFGTLGLVSGASETDYAYIDAGGHYIAVDPDDPGNPFRLPKDSPTSHIKGAGITFHVTYRDVVNDTGAGFDDPVVGGARRSVVDRVLLYIDSVLDETGAVDIVFEESVNDPESGLLAFAGPLFSTQPQFTNGLPFERITTGVDGNGPGMAEMSAQVNFANPWSTGTGNPPPGQFDMFSVLLHEITHGLGLLSFVNDALGTPSNPNVFSVWDNLLVRVVGGDAFPLFTTVFGLPEYVGFSNDLTSSQVVFLGAAAGRVFGGPPPVHAPLEFRPGSSLSHFNQSISGNVVMKPNIPPGTAIRQYADFELGALADLGYSLAQGQVCAPEDTPPIKKAPLITPKGALPWGPAPMASSPKVIYGDDDRLDVFEVTDPDLLRFAASTAALMFNTDLTNNGDGTFQINAAAYEVCPEEPFSNQPVAPFCSGFLAAPDLIVTAGHCVLDGFPLSSYRVVFGFDMLNPTTPRLTVSSERVYSVVEVIERVQTSVLDFAVLRLDRDVSSSIAGPLPIRRDGEILPGTPIGVVGHPVGLPKKVAFGDDTRVMANCNAEFFIANLDTYAGNSGSPVFNAETGLVEGILARGNIDFVALPGAGCQVSYRTAVAAGAEDCTKAAMFAEFIPRSVTEQGRVFFDRELYACDAIATVIVEDANVLLKGLVVSVIVTTGSGDLETLLLEETGFGSGRFEAGITLAQGPVSAGDGRLNVTDGDTLTATYNDTDNGAGMPAVVTDTARAVCGPIIAVSPASRDFGNVVVGTGAQATFTVRNNGTGTLTGQASVASPFSILSGGSYSLDSGAAQTITVAFMPASAGSFTRTVTFTGGGGATAQVTGVGVAQPLFCFGSGTGGAVHSAVGDAVVLLGVVAIQLGAAHARRRYASARQG